MPEGFTKYVVIIVIILLVVVLSQQAFLRQWGKNLSAQITNPVQATLTKGANWVQDKALPTISGEAQKRGDEIKNEINQGKEKISENILEKTKNYISGITNSILHPGSTPACQPAAAEPAIQTSTFVKKAY